MPAHILTTATVPIPLLFAAALGLPADGDELPQRVRQAAALAAVQLTVPDTGARGGGVIVRQEGDTLYVLTAHHLAGAARAVSVQAYTEKSYPLPGETFEAGKPVAASKRQDLAVVAVRGVKGAFPVLPICPPATPPATPPFAGVIPGSLRGLPVNFPVRVRAKRLVRRPGEEALACWEVTPAQGKGFSGGPLVDGDGRVIGIASGSSDGVGYCTHLAEIHDFLDRAGLARLYRPAR